jgi:preprotein translocase subunit YajC
MNRIHDWLTTCRASAQRHPQVLLVLVLLLVFIFSMRPAESSQSQLTATPAPVTLESTPLPPGVSTTDPTNGIIAGAALMVLIIIVGTFSVMRPPSKKR